MKQENRTEIKTPRWADKPRRYGYQIIGGAITIAAASNAVNTIGITSEYLSEICEFGLSLGGVLMISDGLSSLDKLKTYYEKVIKQKENNPQDRINDLGDRIKRKLNRRDSSDDSSGVVIDVNAEEYVRE